jgi:hypothetical protein
MSFREEVILFLSFSCLALVLGAEDALPKFDTVVRRQFEEREIPTLSVVSGYPPKTMLSNLMQLNYELFLLLQLRSHS